MDDLQLLAKTCDPVACGAELEAVRLVLAPLPPGAETQCDAAARDLVDRRRGACEHGGMAEGRGGDERSELESRRPRGEAGERRPRVQDPTALAEPGAAVIRPEERCDAEFVAGVAA